ncbi:MAG: FecR family protein [Treponema sp.]|nr:FecR family protein [Treponema sp.]
MKRILTVILFSLSLSLLPAQAPEAVIREINGTVELKPNGQADWIPAKTGDILAVSTLVSTGFRSSALIAAGSSSILVHPLTRLSLEELISRDETETIQVGLRAGRLRVQVTPPLAGKSDFTVKTPIATASVRGTVFDIDTLNLRVSEGEVRYEGAGSRAVRPVQVNAGQNTWVDSAAGGALNPLTAAEASRALPALPGGNSAPTADSGGASPEPIGGTLSVTVTLDSKP